MFVCFKISPILVFLQDFTLFRVVAGFLIFRRICNVWVVFFAGFHIFGCFFCRISNVWVFFFGKISHFWVFFCRISAKLHRSRMCVDFGLNIFAVSCHPALGLLFGKFFRQFRADTIHQPLLQQNAQIRTGLWPTGLGPTVSHCSLLVEFFIGKSRVKD